MTDNSPALALHAPIGIDEMVAIARIVAGVTGRALGPTESSTLKTAFHRVRRDHPCVTLGDLADVLDPARSA